MEDVSLTSDQQRAYDYVQGRLEEGASHTCLAGYAGTGKTTVVAHLIRSAAASTPIFAAAPTHKAAQVLRGLIGAPAVRTQTIHSFLGLQLRPDGKGGYALSWDGRTRLPEESIVIVDEASMIGNDLWQHITAKEGVQWVFVGDPAQLPPVNETPSPALSVPGIALEHIVRQAADNPILRMATAIRQGGPYLRFTDFSQDRGVALTRSRQKFMKSIVGAFANRRGDDPLDVRVLAYRNDVVRHYNAAIRTALHGAEAETRFLVGEWLMMTDTFFAGDRPLVHNSEEVRVAAVEEGVLATVGGLWRTHMVAAQVGSRTLTLPVLHEAEAARYRDALDTLRQEALGGRRAWNDYYDLRQAFPQLDYAYALTIHKSQGSTFETVYLDHRDAKRSAPAERRSLLYVAATRPARRLALLV